MVYVEKNVITNAIECSLCKQWIHLKCSNLKKNDLVKLEGSKILQCKNCVLSCIGDAVNAEFQLSATAGNFTSLITLNHIKSTFITLCWLLYYISHTFYLFIYLPSIIVCC